MYTITHILTALIICFLFPRRFPRKDLALFALGSFLPDIDHLYMHRFLFHNVFFLAAEKQSTIGKAINIGTDKPTTIQQLAEIIMNATDTEAPLEYRPRPKGDPYGGYAETTQMKKLLEWKPKTPLKDGIKRYHNWAKQNKNTIPHGCKGLSVSSSL